MSYGKTFETDDLRNNNKFSQRLQQNVSGLPEALATSSPKSSTLVTSVSCTCSKGFRTDEALKQHQRDSSIHVELKATGPAGVIKCSCGKTVKDEDGLEKHVRDSLRHRKFEGVCSDGAKNDDKPSFTIPDNSEVSDFVSFPSVWSWVKALQPSYQIRNESSFKPGELRNRPIAFVGETTTINHGERTAQERNAGKKEAKNSQKKPRSKNENPSRNYRVWSSSGRCYPDIGDNHALCDGDCGWCGHCADEADY